MDQLGLIDRTTILLHFGVRYPNAELNSLNTGTFVHMTVHRNKLLFNETNRPTCFQIYSCTKFYVFLGSSSTHHQELATVHSELASYTV
jgi:hypothetical protein